MKKVRKEYLLIYLSPITKYIGYSFFILGFIGLVIIAFLLSNSDLNWNTFEFPLPENAQYGQLNLWLPYMIPGIAASIFFIVGAIFLLRYYYKRGKILNIVLKKSAQPATVIENIQNFYVKVNDVPRREVSFQTADGSIYYFKFFSEHLASIFNKGTEVHIITHKENAYPSPDFFNELLGS